MISLIGWQNNLMKDGFLYTEDIYIFLLQINQK
jgi:hypothetical protein